MASPMRDDDEEEDGGGPLRLDGWNFERDYSTLYQEYAQELRAGDEEGRERLLDEGRGDGGDGDSGIFGSRFGGGLGGRRGGGGGRDGSRSRRLRLRPPRMNYKPRLMALRSFPPPLELWLAPFDDAGIRFAQAAGQGYMGRTLEYLSQFATLASAIELGLAAPLAFYCLAWDGFASWFSYCMLMVVLVSQVPKRFLWRDRPFNVPKLDGSEGFRAFRSQVYKTSSFPSRAVLCSVVYAYAAAYGATAYRGWYPTGTYSWVPTGVPGPPWALRPLWYGAVAGVALCVSLARINLGAHYPSDCVAGFLLGCFCVGAGTLLYAGIEDGCGSCLVGANQSLPTAALGETCYRAGTKALTMSNIGYAYLAPGWVGTIVFTALVLMMMSPPLEFWTKSAHAFGTLAPALLFHFVFLCPGIQSGDFSSARFENCAGFEK